MNVRIPEAETKFLTANLLEETHEVNIKKLVFEVGKKLVHFLTLAKIKEQVVQANKFWR